jgi:hypothetical protein
MVVVPAADDVTDGADVAEVSGGTDVTDHVDVIDVAVSGTCDVVVAVVVVVSAVVSGSAIGGPVVSTPHPAADSAAMIVSATDRQRRPPRIRPSPSRAR